jgi:tetratricopeptide (TPR) repeat protein
LQKAVECYEAALQADAEYPGVWSERGRGQSLQYLGNVYRDLGRMESGIRPLAAGSRGARKK